MGILLANWVMIKVLACWAWLATAINSLKKGSLAKTGADDWSGLEQGLERCDHLLIFEDCDGYPLKTSIKIDDILIIKGKCFKKY